MIVEQTEEFLNGLHEKTDTELGILQAKLEAKEFALREKGLYTEAEVFSFLANAVEKTKNCKNYFPYCRAHCPLWAECN